VNDSRHYWHSAVMYSGVMQSTVTVASESLHEPVNPMHESKEMKGADCGKLKAPSCHLPGQTEKPWHISARMACMLAETQRISWDLSATSLFVPDLKNFSLPIHHVSCNWKLSRHNTLVSTSTEHEHVSTELVFIWLLQHCTFLVCCVYIFTSSMCVCVCVYIYIYIYVNAVI